MTPQRDPKESTAHETGNGSAGPDETSGGMRARARQVGERLDAIGARGLGRMGEALVGAGDAIVDRAGDHRAGQTLAEPLRRAGSYVGQATPSSALADLDRAIERHPYRSLAIGIAAGWALGRLTRRLRARS